MKKYYKLLLLMLGVLIIVTMCIGSSYAYWKTAETQKEPNIVASDCFKLSFESLSDDISLDNAIPMEDEEAKDLNPYVFKIKNICNHSANYNINIETLEGTTLDTNYVKFKLNNASPKTLGSLTNNSSSDFISDKAINSNTIATDTLDPNQEHVYELRFWIDSESSKEESAYKTFKSKVSIYSTLIVEENIPTLLRGEDFNNALRKLAGDTNMLGSSSSACVKEYNIKRIEFSDTLPGDDVEKVKLNYSMNNDALIYGWFDNGTIKIYSRSDVIGLKNYSQRLFEGFSALEYLDLSRFEITKDYTYLSSMFECTTNLKSVDLSTIDTSKVSRMDEMFRESGVENVDLSAFDAKGSNMQDMFRDSDVEYIDLSTFDTSYSSYMNNMFYGARNLKTIYVSDKWSIYQYNNSKSLFNNCTSLVGGAGTAYNSNYVGLEYARIDDPDNGKPGYFTLKTN